VKKLLGKNKIEDALKRLDTLTQEEVRMATAEVLKVTQRVDNKVSGLTALFEGEQYAFLRPNLVLNHGLDWLDGRVAMGGNADEEKRSSSDLSVVGSLSKHHHRESVAREASTMAFSP